MKRFSTLLLLLTFMICHIHAQKWVDVTDSIMKNPRYDKNSTYWLGNQAFTVISGTGTVEHRGRTYDNYQTMLNVTPGMYRVTVYGFYRSGKATSDYDHYKSTDPSQFQYALMYANTAKGTIEAPMPMLASGALPASLGGSTESVGSNLLVPSDAAAALKWIAAGYYKQQVEIEVTSTGRLKVGVKQATLFAEQVSNGWWGGTSSDYSYNWTLIDGWKIEYGGPIVQTTEIKFDKEATRINLDESAKLSPILTPDSASYKRFKWTTSDSKIVSVDQNGVVKGLDLGTATITATTLDGSGLSASIEVTVHVNKGTSESLIINEIMPRNIDMFVDPSWNYGGWLELYNPTDESAFIGKYWLSDDPNNLRKVYLPKRIGNVPAHGFFTLWFDHADTQKDVKENWLNTQVNMSLKPNGGTIYISDDEGNLVTSLDYPATAMRTAYARKTDGGNEWGFTATPTPTATNAGSTFATEQLPTPVTDKAGQLFTGQLTVKIKIPSGALLYYTTDGTTPTLTNGKRSYGGIFTISNSTVYRFRFFGNGYLPSNVTTHTYILKDKDYYLPIVSIATDPDNLYDNTIGVYCDGTNGKTANQDHTKRNFNMEWDRPVNFEYLVDGSEEFNQEVNFAICGGWSRKYMPKSFKLKAAKEYGLNELPYTFFPDKSYNKNKVVLMRNGGNDNYNKYRMKDAALQALARESGFRLNLQSYRPAHVFFNGQYLAMLNMREPSNKHYGYANYGIPTDDIDAFEMSVDSGYVQKDGTKEAFREWYNLSKTVATNAESYRKICEIVDIDDYCNLMAWKLYLYDWDWPHNNMKAFKGRTDGKFHFMTFDLDNCIDWSSNQTNENIFTSFANKKTYQFYARPEYDDARITAEVELVTIFLNMIKNAEFKKKFIDTFSLVGGCVFGEEQEIRDIVNGIANNIRPALLWEGNDPTGSGREQAQGVINAVTGNYKSKMATTIKNYSAFGLGAKTAQEVKLSANVEGAHVTLNGIDIPRAKFNGYLFAPIVFKAEAPAGYKFAGWTNGGATKTQTTTIFAKQQSWSYYDRGSLDNTSWKAPSYTASTWKTGTAPFGWGNSGKPMANAKTNFKTLGTNGKPTYYFRKEFTLDEAPTDKDVFTFNYDIDDGIIVYVNGTEVGLYHMQSGANYSNVVQDFNGGWYEGDNPYSSSITIKSTLLKQGKNVIAVEVHNCNSTSSDLWFDGSLTVTSPVAPSAGDFLSTDPEYTLPTTGNHTLTAVFTKIEAGDEMPSVSPVRINEVSAANDIYINEFFKKSDWIELYNTTDADIDVAGMYISDNVSKPLKYLIPESDSINTIIPAHGHLIVWCDKVEPMSQIHASFKLAAEGGSLILTAADESWSDKIDYCEHLWNATVGRYPDGCDNVYTMINPSIGKKNIMTLSYDALYEQSRESEVDVNGDGNVDTQDVLLIYEFMAESRTVTVDTPEDVNHDGSVDTQDVLMIYSTIKDN